MAGAWNFSISSDRPQVGPALASFKHALPGQGCPAHSEGNFASPPCKDHLVVNLARSTAPLSCLHARTVLHGMSSPSLLCQGGSRLLHDWHGQMGLAACPSTAPRIMQRAEVTVWLHCCVLVLGKGAARRVFSGSFLRPVGT